MNIVEMLARSCSGDECGVKTLGLSIYAIYCQLVGLRASPHSTVATTVAHLCLFSTILDLVSHSNVFFNFVS